MRRNLASATAFASGVPWRREKPRHAIRYHAVKVITYTRMHARWGRLIHARTSACLRISRMIDHGVQHASSAKAHIPETPVARKHRPAVSSCERRRQPGVPCAEIRPAAVCGADCGGSCAPHRFGLKHEIAHVVPPPTAQKPGPSPHLSLVAGPDGSGRSSNSFCDALQYRVVSTTVRRRFTNAHGAGTPQSSSASSLSSCDPGVAGFPVVCGFCDVAG
jgi:hypothetical protein